MHKRKTTIVIILLVLLWGLSWPIYKVGLNYTPPILFAGMRTFFGGIILSLVALPTYKQIKFRENWRIYTISALFNVILFFGMQTIGLTYLPSGLFSVLVYLEPVLVGFLAWRWLGESLTPVKIFGLILGFLGVAAVSEAGFSGTNSIPGILLGIVTAISWAIGTVYLKKVQNKINIMWLIAVHCLIGGFVLTLLGTFIEPWSSIQWKAPYLASLLYGSLIGTSFSWVLWNWLVYQGEVSRVAAFTFMVPLLSVAIGTIFLHEPMSEFLVVGLVFTALSIYLVNRPAKKQLPLKQSQGYTVSK